MAQIAQSNGRKSRTPWIAGVASAHDRRPTTAARQSRPGDERATKCIVTIMPVFAMLGLVAMTGACGAQAFEAGSNIGQTEIDKIIRKKGYGGIPTMEPSPLSKALRAFLVERAKQGGAAAVEAALSEAGASCRPPIDSTRHCELRRFRVLRSIDFLFPKYGRTDWIISVSYDRRGNAAQNIHVTYTVSYELIR
ncbi:hypothetical protein [Blastochloris sulfoviridis]|uniref:Uncharacterized protein n=1 Tax=Blastochloris sulfoviridis TaxID=50712 RepID=A0A5M6HN83_9HYPH|nr:hypothetical protein [Blastochloris sulfoviridis]KAA5597138.1 hypothetical protein F1193_15155 [Blastochloris sulfoviridis]